MIINPQRLTGPWKAGYALDLHTLSSAPKEWSMKKITETVLIDGVPVSIEKEVKDKVIKWDTIYTEIGLEMNHLKYWGEKHRAAVIADIAVDFLMQLQPTWNIDLIIPIPPSNTTREFQPLYEIAEHMTAYCSLPIDFHSLKEIKIDFPTERN
jgi:competence protein ComFC